MQIEEFIKDPFVVQERVLRSLVNQASATKFGREHNFVSIKNYEQFSSQVPLCFYEDIEEDIEKVRQGARNIFWNTDIKWFAKSSGTTNSKSKFIPISEESLRDCHYKAGKDMLCLYLNNNPSSELFTGKSLRLGGSKKLYEDKGTIFGDLSAILIENLPFWAEMRCTPGNKVSQMSEWESKLVAIIEEARHENVTSLTGVPSWMLVLLNKVLETTNKTNLLEVWENLEVYFHGGVSMLPYREQYKQLIPRGDFRYYETYNASEGFFAIQDRNGADDLLLMLDYGIFFEFIPMDTFGTDNQKVIPLWEVEADKNYAMVITTNGGLWRYIIGDTIRFTSTSPFRIKITGRTKHFINVFGEELIIENAEKALKHACTQTNSTVKEYTVAPIFMKGREKGSHEWMIEFDREPSSLSVFTEIMDKELQNLNSDYEAKRYKDMTLTMPVIRNAKKGLFHEWMKQNEKLGGQNKVPRMSNSRQNIEQLIELNK